MAGYKGKYLKTYFWSGLSLVLGFISMFIVAPLTTGMPEAYGVYSLCVSFRIFLQYADLGFINAGRKYAAEAFAIGNVEREKKYVGTSIFIYGMMTLFFFLTILLFSVFPEIVIKDIDQSEYYAMSHTFLLILAFTFPLSIIQKFNGLIYSVRIEDYKIQGIQIVGSIIKIVSVPFVFFNEKYDIVGYYLFCEIINVLISLIILIKSNKIGYGCKELFRCLRIDKAIFKEIMPLALGGFASTIGWIFYYELDTIGVSALLGAEAVAIYAIGKQIQSFVRTLVGIVFSPYPTRINYFIGTKDYVGLKSFVLNISEIFSFIVIPILTISLFADSFVIAWVGGSYVDSGNVLRCLVLTFLFSYLTSISSAVIYGLNKVKDLISLSFAKPILFWIGIFLTYRQLGVLSFPIFQLLACLFTDFYYLYLEKKYIGLSNKEFFPLLIKPLIVFTVSCTLFWTVTRNLFDGLQKGHSDLLYVIMVMALCCVFAFAIDVIFNHKLRQEIIVLLLHKK